MLLSSLDVLFPGNAVKLLARISLLLATLHLFSPAFFALPFMVPQKIIRADLEACWAGTVSDQVNGSYRCSSFLHITLLFPPWCRGKMGYHCGISQAGGEAAMWRGGNQEERVRSKGLQYWEELCKPFDLGAAPAHHWQRWMQAGLKPVSLPHWTPPCTHCV